MFSSVLSWQWQILLVPVTLFYANGFEWWTHKYVLHGLGRNPKSFWKFHWGDHHKNARRNQFLDSDYKESILKWNAQGKEVLALIMGGILHLPILLLAPLCYATLVYAGMRYYFTHRKSHLDPEWAKRRLPWHYDHHMGPNQNMNWCVTRPWFDHIMRTRVPFFKQ